MNPLVIQTDNIATEIQLIVKVEKRFD